MVCWAGPSRTLPISMIDGQYLTQGAPVGRRRAQEPVMCAEV
jgi:hypothetical protein